MTATDEADRLLEAARERLERLLPADAVLGDAHAHLGLDEDGMSLSLEALLDGMDRHGLRRALVFPLNEPDREPNYRAPNDRVLDWAAQSDGRLVPLARLDLNGDPIGEAKRCIARGARGIKLHPRAQRFTVDDSRLEPVFALAEEHRLPILIHAGRGMPPIGADLARVSERHPGAILILAHGAIVDQERIARLVAGMPNVFFDTSTFGLLDVLALLSLVPPEQVLYAADVPYGTFLSGLTLVASLLEELEVEEGIRRGILGETLEGIVRGELPELTSPVAPPDAVVPYRSLRIYGYLASAMPLIWTSQPDVIGLMGLALGACGDDPALAGVAELIDVSARVWAEAAQHGGEDGVSVWRSQGRTVYSLTHLAQVAAMTPRTSAALPV